MSTTSTTDKVRQSIKINNRVAKPGSRVRFRGGDSHFHTGTIVRFLGSGVVQIVDTFGLNGELTQLDSNFTRPVTLHCVHTDDIVAVLPR